MKTEENNQLHISQGDEKHHEQTPVNEARERLKSLSQTVKHLVAEGKFATINEALLATYYRNEQNTEFKHYGEWKEEGFQVRKGEKAFLLWGHPQKTEQEKGDDEKEQDEDRSFFPIAHLFSNSQVSPIERTTLDELKEAREQSQDLETDIER